VQDGIIEAKLVKQFPLLYWGKAEKEATGKSKLTVTYTFTQ
jgi:hypothetical protein